MDTTPHQKKIIKRYYENRDVLMSQKLSELVTELYLAEGKKRLQLWKRVAAALTNLGVDQQRIDTLIATDNPAKILSLVKP